MDEKANVNLEENPKEKLAREIAKNMSEKRREKAFDNENSVVKTLSKDDFIKEPVSKTKLLVCGLIGFFVAFLIVFYIGGLIKFDGKFLPNTYINNGNFGGSSKGEAVKLFKIAQNHYVPEEITVIKKDGTIAKISSEKIGYSDNIEKKVNEIYKNQNHYLWFKNLFSYEDFDFSVEYSFDFDKLKDECRRKIIDASSKDEPKNAVILKEGDNFVIEKEIQRTKIASEKEKILLDYVENAVKDGKMDINISNLDCYESPEIVSSDLENACEQLNKLKNCKFTFDFDYQKETLEGKDVLDWITTDFQSIDEPFDVQYELVMEYVENKLSKKYDTYGLNIDRTFNSTSRGTIIVKQGQGNYGWWLDQEKTCNALIDAIKNCKSKAIKPIYYTSTETGYQYVGNKKWRSAKSDIGKTYMEIDLKKQRFWYYENGKKKHSCKISSVKRDKVSNGVYKLWQKAKDKNVGGKKSKYWANISSGGPVLCTVKSDSNIKMSDKDMKYIYEKIPNGTPCIMYW